MCRFLNPDSFAHFNAFIEHSDYIVSSKNYIEIFAAFHKHFPTEAISKKRWLRLLTVILLDLESKGDEIRVFLNMTF